MGASSFNLLADPFIAAASLGDGASGPVCGGKLLFTPTLTTGGQEPLDAFALCNYRRRPAPFLQSWTRLGPRFMAARNRKSGHKRDRWARMMRRARIAGKAVGVDYSFNRTAAGLLSRATGRACLNGQGNTAGLRPFKAGAISQPHARQGIRSPGALRHMAGKDIKTIRTGDGRRARYLSAQFKASAFRAASEGG